VQQRAITAFAASAAPGSLPQARRVAWGAIKALLLENLPPELDGRKTSPTIWFAQRWRKRSAVRMTLGIHTNIRARDSLCKSGKAVTYVEHDLNAVTPYFTMFPLAFRSGYESPRTRAVCVTRSAAEALRIWRAAFRELISVGIDAIPSLPRFPRLNWFRTPTR
jgi:hypothetical protein